jgi:hypothetical protein
MLLSSAGGALCQQLVVRNSSSLLCTADAAAVGRYPVVVSLNGVNSSVDSDTGRVVRRMCGKDLFGLPGAYCGACPKVQF